MLDELFLDFGSTGLLRNLEDLEKSGNLIFNQINQRKVRESQLFIQNSGKTREFEKI